MYIPYGHQYIDDDDVNSVVQVLKSEYLTCGPVVPEFEKQFATYAGAKYAVAVSSGTAALHAACYASGIQPGDEVITSPITFAASSNAAFYLGAKPVFADIDPLTYNISPAETRKKITKKTKAIIPVHYTGQPCAMGEIMSIAEEYGLTVIEDAAHAVGAYYHRRAVGGISPMTTFSFHPVKQMTSGEGGMITTNDSKLYEKLLLFRTHGITRSNNLMSKNEGPWYYEQISLGYNYRITDIQAALGISQLKKVDSFIKRRKEIAAMYNAAFESTDEIITPFQSPNCESSWHLYVVKLKSKDRRTVFEYLRSKNIGVNVHYIPVYKHPFYRENGFAHENCFYAEELYSKIISLPIYYSLKDSEIKYVIETLLECISGK